MHLHPRNHAHRHGHAHGALRPHASAIAAEAGPGAPGAARPSLAERQARSGENVRRLRTALVLAASYMVAEAIGGYVTGSLALLADAGHMLSDVGALALALFALWLARRPPTARRTYGFYRAEILAALANGSVLVAIALVIFLEAFERFRTPQPVEGPLMMAVAAGGLLVNLAALRVLGPGRGDSLNVRGAWLHVLSDTLGSAQAILAGLLVWKLGWLWADPLASVMIGLLLVVSSWNLLREAVAVLMEGTPEHLDLEAIRGALLATPGVRGVHDLHLWTLTSGHDALSGHVEMQAGEDAVGLLPRLRGELHDRFGIEHLTLQVEPAGFVERGCCGDPPP